MAENEKEVKPTPKDGESVEEEDFELDEEADGDEGEEGKDKKTPEQKRQERSNETPEAKRARLTRQLEQHDKKYPVDKKVVKKPNSNESADLDYGQKAYLIANGIKGAEETALVQDYMKETGRSLEQVMESKFFQGELTALREFRTTQEATPTGTKRNGQSPRSSVEYWLAKGELPPADQRELRQKVVKAKIAKAKSGNVFTSTPVVK